MVGKNKVYFKITTLLLASLSVACSLAMFAKLNLRTKIRISVILFGNPIGLTSNSRPQREVFAFWLVRPGGHAILYEIRSQKSGPIRTAIPPSEKPAFSWYGALAVPSYE